MVSRRLALSCAIVLMMGLFAYIGVVMAYQMQPAGTGKNANSYWVYVGDYGKAEKQGIYLFRLDVKAGTLAPGTPTGDSCMPPIAGTTASR
jgi:hypothetical protein